VDPFELAADHRPGLPGRVLGDADEQQRQSAQQDVGADPLFEPVVDRPQVKDGFHVPPAALDFEELLVSGGEQFTVRITVVQRAQMTQIGVDHGRHRLTSRLRHIGGDARLS
jgi:hypothetical protein